MTTYQYLMNTYQRIPEWLLQQWFFFKSFKGMQSLLNAAQRMTHTDAAGAEGTRPSWQSGPESSWSCLNVWKRFFPVLAEVMLDLLQSGLKLSHGIWLSADPSVCISLSIRILVCWCLVACVRLQLCVCIWVAVLHFIRHKTGGLEKWVSASLVVPSLSLLLMFFHPSLSYPQVGPRIKTKHLRLSTPPVAAWIWVKLAITCLF